jgi:hypothetical protein
MTSIPEVGSFVTVTTRFPKTYLYSESEYEFYTHTGEVVKPDSWLRSDDFNLRTNNPNYPVSTINVRNIVDIKYISGKARELALPTATRQFKVTSKSTGKTYIVTAVGTKITCNCPGFVFRRYCKHSAAVAKKA